MNLIAGAVEWLAQRLGRLGECGIAGVIVGGVGGIILSLYALLHPGPIQLTVQELALIGLLLTVLGWLVLIFVFVALVRAEYRAVRAPALVNAFLVAFLTTFIAHAAGILHWAWLVGLIVGALVGFLLCTLHKRWRR